MCNCRWKVLLLLHLLGHSSDEEVGVQVQAVRAAGTLALDVRLVVHAEHGVSPVASHHQLMPAALTDLHFADHRPCARTRVEPEEKANTNFIPGYSQTSYQITALEEFVFHTVCWLFIEAPNDEKKSAHVAQRNRGMK